MMQSIPSITDEVAKNVILQIKVCHNKVLPCNLIIFSAYGRIFLDSGLDSDVYNCICSPVICCHIHTNKCITFSPVNTG